MEKRFMILVLSALSMLLKAIILSYCDSKETSRLCDEIAALRNDIESG